MGFVAKLAVLDGYVTGKDEKICEKYPFTSNLPSFWQKKIMESLDKTAGEFEIVTTNIENISEEFAIVLNPFGEEYPEIDRKYKPAFNAIKNFIEDGGIYVNTGGFPFFYAWDVLEGKEYPLSDEKVVIPSVHFKEGEPPRSELVALLSFTGTLLFKEFDAIPAPVSKVRKIYQDQQDIEKFGNLVAKDSPEVIEFRAMPKSTKDCIPVIRAKDETVEELFPVYALKRGNGFLLNAGMNTSGDREANLFAKAVCNFCIWFSKQL